MSLVQQNIPILIANIVWPSFESGIGSFVYQFEVSVYSYGPQLLNAGYRDLNPQQPANQQYKGT